MSKRTPGRPTAHVRAGTPAPVSIAPNTPRTTVRAGPAPELRITVDRHEPPEHLFRRLLSAYLGGATALEVEERPALSPESRNVVREFCRRTRRLQPVHDTGRLLELYDLEPPTAVDLDGQLARLGERVVEFHREAVESWSGLPLGDDGYWSRRDDDVDREAWYLERCLARDGPGGDVRSAAASWTIARSLERIADHAVTLGELGPRVAELGSGGCLVREVRQYHLQAMAHLEAVLQSPDGSRANELLDVGEALVAGGRTLSDRLLPAVGDGSMSPASAAAVARALEAIGRTIAYSQDIAQAFFDRSQRSGTDPARPGAIPLPLP